MESGDDTFVTQNTFRDSSADTVDTDGILSDVLEMEQSGSRNETPNFTFRKAMLAD